MTSRCAILVPVLALAACHPGAESTDNMAGERLEAASIAAGLVADPATVPLDGIWARDSDRICILPASETRGDAARRIGVLVDYGEGQGCVGRGTLARSGRTLDIDLDGCRFAARLDGDGIQFPASVPAACNALCSGRASLSALNVERVSASVAEAQALRGPNGTALCAD
ncbi:hypothetical protein [Sphingomonas sp.]|uniref:hypothetical protein n=1 Tax=Sphingomonas sp. TaxID=28214 RepID=UPI002898F7EC|nr:hypothetical protein [Sphingomonas sp.]